MWSGHELLVLDKHTKNKLKAEIRHIFKLHIFTILWHFSPCFNFVFLLLIYITYYKSHKLLNSLNLFFELNNHGYYDKKLIIFILFSFFEFPCEILAATPFKNESITHGKCAKVTSLWNRGRYRPVGEHRKISLRGKTFFERRLLEYLLYARLQNSNKKQ